jgi:hypothetical protein
MQGSTGQGNQNGQKQGGLSWTQPPASSTGASTPNNAQGGMKPLSQTTPSAMPPKASQPSSASSASKSAPLSSIKKADAKAGTSGAKLASTFLAGVIVGLIIGWGWFSLGGDNSKVATTTTPNNSSSSETTSGTNTNTTPAVVSSGASGSGITVATQPAGLQVAVSNISVSVPTWVVVLANVDGKPGNALGAQMFFPGQTAGTIDLLVKTVSGKSYFIGQFVDNGDHRFSRADDTQVNTVAGSPMLSSFRVQ